MSQTWWTSLAAAANDGAREVLTCDPVPPGSALLFGAQGDPARGQWVLTITPGRRLSGDHRLTRLAAPLHRNYPAGERIRVETPNTGLLSGWCAPLPAWVYLANGTSLVRARAAERCRSQDSLPGVADPLPEAHM